MAACRFQAMIEELNEKTTPRKYEDFMWLGTVLTFRVAEKKDNFQLKNVIFAC